MCFIQPQISQYIVKQLERQINQLIDREKIIPEQKMAELKKCLSTLLEMIVMKRLIIPAFLTDTHIFTIMKNLIGRKLSYEMKLRN